jgi:uncharacterized protein
MKNKTINIQNKEAEVILRPAKLSDFERILQLNEEFVYYLNQMSAEQLNIYNSYSELNLVAEIDGKVEAFVLVFRENTDYDFVTYLLFKERYEKFLYVDRIVVSAKCQGLGIASMLYNKIMEHARNTGVSLVTAEVDSDPPNPVSLGFHEKFGFKNMGNVAVPGTDKFVVLQVAELQ